MLVKYLQLLETSITCYWVGGSIFCKISCYLDLKIASFVTKTVFVTHFANNFMFCKLSICMGHDILYHKYTYHSYVIKWPTIGKYCNITYSKVIIVTTAENYLNNDQQSLGFDCIF